MASSSSVGTTRTLTDDPSGEMTRAPDDGLPNTDRVMNRGLSLPSHNALTSDDVGHIVESVEECLHAFS